MNLLMEFNFILKEILKQVYDTVEQKDLFGNIVIGAGDP